MAKKKKTKKIPSMTEDEIKNFAKAVFRNEVFISQQIKATDMHLLSSIFMALALGGLAGFTEKALDDIGTIWEYYNKAGLRAINGYPMFMSCRIMNMADWDKAVGYLKKLEDAEKAI
jgi:hypothetical protein